RQGARVPGRRAGRRVPAARRNDPAGAPGRRPARLRDRDRRHEPGGARAGRGGSELARCGGGMTCDFSLDHYRDLLRAARAGGYRWGGFDPPPEPGVVILRHDVDLSLDAAIAIAEVEAEEAAWSTWFLMTRSVFYNLASSEGERAISRLHELGHRVAHHAVW